MELIGRNGPTSELLTLVSGGQLVTDRFGMSSARAVWWFYGPNPEAQVSIFSRHPRWSFLEMDKRTITRNQDGSWEIAGDYFGVDGNPDPIYALDTSSTQEPIMANPRFYQFAGTATAPLNGAKFDSDGLFLGFSPTTGTPPGNAEWLGVEAYLSYSAVWRETRVTKSKPGPGELSAINKINSPPGNPPTPSGRNWLYVSPSFEQKAKTYVVRKEWLLSGPAGWNTTLYGA